MRNLEDYRKEFEDLKKSLDLVKEILNHREVKAVKPSLATKEAREEFWQFFALPEFYQICHRCGGKCCTSFNFALRPIELFYFVAVNPNFKWPKPDWQFLKEKKMNGGNQFPCDPCIFLSPTGCLLRECRPEVCLSFRGCRNLLDKIKEIYSKTEEEKLFFVQRSLYGKEIKIFCDRILRAAGISEGEKSYMEIKNYLIYGTVGFLCCTEILERIAAEIKEV